MRFRSYSVILILILLIPSNSLSTEINSINNPKIIPDQSLNNGLLAYYQFENASDSSGNGYDSTAYNMDFSSEGVSDQSGTFNGVSSRMAISTDNNWDFGNQITISLWATISELYGHFFSDHRTVSFRILTTGELIFRISTDGSTWTNQVETTDLNLNTHTEFVHYAVSYNGSYANFYVNGLLVHQQVLTASIHPSITSSVAEIGHFGGASESRYYFEGKMDEMRIYKRGLNTSEISDIYNLNRPVEDQQPVDLYTDLLTYYQFENSSDNSGNGYDAIAYDMDFSNDGLINHSGTFDGISSRMAISTDSNWNFGNQITISLWATITELYGTLFSDHRTVSFRILTTGELIFRLSTDGSYWTHEVKTSGLGLSPHTEFVHYAVSYNASYASIYLNGSLVHEEALTASIHSSITTSTAEIGHFGGASESRYYFEGKMDEMRIYKRGLNEKEIKDLYLLNYDYPIYNNPPEEEDDSNDFIGIGGNYGYDLYKITNTIYEVVELELQMIGTEFYMAILDTDYNQAVLSALQRFSDEQTNPHNLADSFTSTNSIETQTLNYSSQTVTLYIAIYTIYTIDEKASYDPISMKYNLTSNFNLMPHTAQMTHNLGYSKSGLIEDNGDEFWDDGEFIIHQNYTLLGGDILDFYIETDDENDNGLIVIFFNGTNENDINNVMTGLLNSIESETFETPPDLYNFLVTYDYGFISYKAPSQISINIGLFAIPSKIPAHIQFDYSTNIENQPVETTSSQENQSSEPQLKISISFLPVIFSGVVLALIYRKFKYKL